MANNPWSESEAAIVRAHIHESDADIAQRLHAQGFTRETRAVEAYRKMVLGVRRPCAVSTWTDQRIETLKALWKEGLSGSMIAKRLGGVSRNAVIGKAYRLKLGVGSQRLDRGRDTERVRRRVVSKSQDANRPPKLPRNKQKPAAPFIVSGWRETGPVAPTIILQPGAEIESPNAKPWTERRFGRECAFPVGEASGADQWSCCNPVKAGTYCPEHRALCNIAGSAQVSRPFTGRQVGDMSTMPCALPVLGGPVEVDNAVDPDKQRGRFTSRRFFRFGEDAA